MAFWSAGVLGRRIVFRPAASSGRLMTFRLAAFGSSGIASWVRLPAARFFRRPCHGKRIRLVYYLLHFHSCLNRFCTDSSFRIVGWEWSESPGPRYLDDHCSVSTRPQKQDLSIYTKVHRHHSSRQIATQTERRVHRHQSHRQQENGDKFTGTHNT